MDELINELKIIINKELFQKEIISFSEFKIMNEEGDVTKYFDTQKHDIKIFNKSIPTFKFQKIWGSYLLPIIIKKVTNLAHKIYSGNFKNIPQNNNL